MHASTEDRHVFLMGRPPIGEFLGFVRTLAVEGESFDLGVLADEWRAANDHIRELEESEEGLADSVSLLPVEASLGAAAAQIVGDPVTHRTFGFVPLELGLVELDRLVVFQKHINLEYVQELRGVLGESPSAEDVFRFCFPVAATQLSVQATRLSYGEFNFVSPSNDLRFIEPILLEPSQVAGYTPQGRPQAIIGLVVGYGANFVHAIHAEGRLILNNGGHRAYALRESGVTHAPCLVSHVSRRDELEIVGSGELNERPDAYLTVARPPLLKDYFDPELRKLVSVLRRARHLRVSFGSETIDLPI